MTIRFVLRSPFGETVVRDVSDGRWVEPVGVAEATIGEGAWALPGLVDAHAHLAAAELDYLPGDLTGAMARASESLLAGVTLVLDKGWTDESVRALLDSPRKLVFLMGGSTTLGYGVSGDETISWYLNAAAGSAGGFTAVNLGSQAYDQHREIEKLSYLLRAGYRPRQGWAWMTIGFAALSLGPFIYVVDGNYANRGELYMAHKHNGLDLEIKFAVETLKNVFKVWQRPVHLQAKIDDLRRDLDTRANRDREYTGPAGQIGPPDSPPPARHF